MPEMRKKTCDIVCRYGKQDYYIEVKTRFGRQGPGAYVLETGYNSSVNKIVEHAVKQLSEMPDGEGYYRLIWFIVHDDDESEFLLHSLVHTLYGVQRLCLERGDLRVEVDCFFYVHCPMRKFPALDAVVIQTRKGLVFCLNNFSAHHHQFRHSHMFTLNKRLDGVIDPVALERSGCCLLPDFTVPSKQVAHSILKKYGFHQSTRISTRTQVDSRVRRF